MDIWVKGHADVIRVNSAAPAQFIKLNTTLMRRAAVTSHFKLLLVRVRIDFTLFSSGVVTSRWNYFMQGNMYVPLRRCTFYFIVLFSYVTLHVGQSSRFSDVSIEADL